MSKQLFSLKDFDHMVTIEKAVMDALTPYRNGRTEAALVCIALLRVTRTLLYLYPKATIALLLPQFLGFLKGEASQPGQSDSPLWMPPTSVN